MREPRRREVAVRGSLRQFLASRLDDREQRLRDAVEGSNDRGVVLAHSRGQAGGGVHLRRIVRVGERGDEEEDQVPTRFTGRGDLVLRTDPARGAGHGGALTRGVVGALPRELLGAEADALVRLLGFRLGVHLGVAVQRRLRLHDDLRPQHLEQRLVRYRHPAVRVVPLAEAVLVKQQGVTVVAERVEDFVTRVCAGDGDERQRRTVDGRHVAARGRDAPLPYRLGRELFIVRLVIGVDGGHGFVRSFPRVVGPSRPVGAGDGLLVGVPPGIRTVAVGTGTGTGIRIVLARPVPVPVLGEVHVLAPGGGAPVVEQIGDWNQTLTGDGVNLKRSRRHQRRRGEKRFEPVRTVVRFGETLAEVVVVGR